MKPDNLPPSGTPIRIIRKADIGGQVEAVYRATLLEGFLFSNPRKSTLEFCRWEDLERLEPNLADGVIGNR